MEEYDRNLVIIELWCSIFNSRLYKTYFTIVPQDTHNNCHCSYQARQTRPNSGGVAEGHPRFDKGGVAIIIYFLRVKNITL